MASVLCHSLHHSVKMAAMGSRLKCLSKGYSMSVEDKENRVGFAHPVFFCLA